ncbi:hypothetical protein [Estrella lausannensis]|uniref:Conserved putative membrane protein n=1 Tax=Estrella lausannensis TaxID=483423 RepID=A0A0H5DRL8_9BACT|nr:hypothetical protein [Estrella lausannensis]CRX38349.1 Conserved putative membrane protein [Estrella lausannensis]
MAMDRLIRELESGDLHLRDQWQFELKSEFIPSEDPKKNRYIQEFFIFIPNSLQINDTTYQKQDFYRDQSTYIRYKTPIFTFQELCDRHNKRSPLQRLFLLMQSNDLEEAVPKLEDELKLLANVFRSTLRMRIHSLFKTLTQTEHQTVSEAISSFAADLKALEEDLTLFRLQFDELTLLIQTKCTIASICQHLFYVEEFMSHTVSYYFTGLLKRIREINSDKFPDSELLTENLLIKEKQRRKGIIPEPEEVQHDLEKSEYIFYRHGLINKYVADALLLNVIRSSPDTGLQHLIGSLAAFVAMFFFFVLFIWQGRVFIINSEPFILATVVLYVLKDRIKESLRNVSYRKAVKWFPDFKTEIKSPDEKVYLGVLSESFTFIKEKNLSEDIRRARNKEFHVILEDLKRSESIMHFKKTIQMLEGGKKDARRNSLNAIFRFNIQRFLLKADNPFQGYFTIDDITREFQFLHLPKVYHINIIVKNSAYNEKGELVSEIKKFRLIADKNGIKRIEQVK